jgi:septum formation protein
MSFMFILASSSPRRRQLFATLNIPFSIQKPDIDENQRPGEPPLDYVCRLSREKAAAIAERCTPPALVLAADTIVILGADTLGVDQQGEILGKPADAADARQMLRRLRGCVHQVCTAITLIKLDTAVGASHALPPDDNSIFNALTRTDVTMRDYTDAEIEIYIATGDPFDKAGSYAIQHPVFRPVARLDGCYTNVVGLPMCTLKNMLAEIGWPDISSVTPAPNCTCREDFAAILA